MGIYISGVKGLPEQVQENKNKIKEVEEQIEGIDFDAIRELEAQVGENTQDINNLEASIGVQNQTINALGNRTTALERKTQLMTYNDDYSKTDFRNSIEVADDVIANGVHVAGDGVVVNANGSGLHFQEGSDDTTVTIANNDGAVYHALQLHGDGTLTLDGNPVGKTYYRHNISFTYNSNNYNFTIVSSQINPYNFATLIAYMYAQDFTSSSKNIHNPRKTSVYNLDYYYYVSQTILYVEVFRDGTFLREDDINTLNITDSVVEV